MKGSTILCLVFIATFFIFSDARSFDCEEYLTKFANKTSNFNGLDQQEFFSLLGKADDSMTEIQYLECVRQYGKLHPIWKGYLSAVQGSGEICTAYACTRCTEAESRKGYDTTFKIGCAEIIDNHPGDRIFLRCSLEHMRKEGIPLHLGECSLTKQMPY